ncbi:MAG TPA: Ig-like domain-containing protein, partial [Solirubrobacteraceae bacterium]
MDDHKPVFSGAAGTAPGDSSRIKVTLFSASGTLGSPLRTLRATVFDGRWVVAPTRPLADGTYRARAAQSDRAGNTGVSALSTFTIDTTSPSHGSGGVVSQGAKTSAPKSYSVGGTVSGLSGMVVLQDNGGDDLSVSRNGAFSFATRLASGAAYNVTVKTNPSGQTCSVS